MTAGPERAVPSETSVPRSLEFLPLRDPVRRFFEATGPVDQLRLRDFHQTRSTLLKLGRTPEEATDQAVTGRLLSLSAEIRSDSELAWQINLIDRFADCYRNPASVA